MLPFELLLLAVLASAQPTQNNESLKVFLNWSQISLSSGQPRPSSHQYQCFNGNINNYPPPEAWLCWDALWDTNRELILSTNAGDTYLQHYIQTSTLKVASETSVDARLILAIIMQETNGHATAPCVGPVPRCGIMHAEKGHGFDPSRAQDSITDMIREAVRGSLKGGPGLAQLLSGNSRIANLPPGNPYAAARSYNSRSVGSNLDEAFQGQVSYANDVANRLIGWDGTGKGFNAC